MSAEVLISPDPGAVGEEAARRFVREAVGAVEARGRFSAVLSGGSTPAALFRRLSEPPFREQVAWAGVHLPEEVQSGFGQDRGADGRAPLANYQSMKARYATPGNLAPEKEFPVFLRPP